MKKICSYVFTVRADCGIIEIRFNKDGENFMGIWRECLLGDIVTFQRGYDLPKTKMNGGIYPVVASNGIIGYHNKFTTEEPSITVGRSGNVGNPFLYKGKSWSHNTTLYIREYKNVDPFFIYYFLKTLDLKNYAGGSAVPTLNRNHIHSLPVKIPTDILAQKQIASILSSYDNLIENNQKQIRLLEEIAQRFYKEWFVDFAPFGEVMPDDWTECGLESMCSLIVKGITPKYTDISEQIIINQKCIRNHQIDLSLTRCHTPKSITEKWLQYGDIVVNSTGTGTLGRTAQVLFVPKNLTVDSHVTIIRPTKFEYIFYLGLWCISHEHDFEMLATGSTGQTDLPRERLKKMQILLPNDNILIEFSNIIKPICDMMIRNQQENKNLSAIRDTLLPKLMNGEIDVSEVRI